MDAGSVAAIIAALGVGGLLGGWLRAEHERTERFRERMITAAERFLADVDIVRAAVDDAIHVIPDTGEVDRAKMNEALRRADRGILTAEGRLSSLAVSFPDRPGRERQIPIVASDYTDAMRRLCQALAEVQSRESADLDRLERAMYDAGVYHGMFTSMAQEQIWRRWFLRQSPSELLSHRLQAFWSARRGSREGDLARDAEILDGELP